MKKLYFNFYDDIRQRQVPVALYFPVQTLDVLQTVIFNPGYQSQNDLKQKEAIHKRYTFLAEYFTSKGYAFITIQNDLIGDIDGLETIDPDAPQDEARRYLYIRGEANILFVVDRLKKENLSLNLDQFILSGHSNGGDIAKYFVNNNPSFVTKLILFDSRRAKLRSQAKLQVLMFEADDTMTDSGVIPEPMQKNNSMRSNLDLVIIKLSGALHVSYVDDYITDELKVRVLACLNWFLENDDSIFK